MRSAAVERHSHLKNPDHDHDVERRIARRSFFSHPACLPHQSHLIVKQFVLTGRRDFISYAEFMPPSQSFQCPDLLIEKPKMLLSAFRLASRVCSVELRVQESEAVWFALAGSNYTNEAGWGEGHE